MRRRFLQTDVATTRTNARVATQAAWARQGGGYGVQEPAGFRLRDEQHYWVRKDEQQGDRGDLSVELINDVDPVRGRHVSDARGQGELQAQNRKPGEAQGHGELFPEPPVRGDGP